ncbi:MAG: sensor histidine kinase [Gemmatimonadales bacterium]
MKRPNLVWLQLLIGWLPVWALLSTLIGTAHPEVEPLFAVLYGFRLVAAAAILAVLVDRLTIRLPWPRVIRPQFALIHLVAAAAYASLWVASVSLVESVFRRQLVLVTGPTGVFSFLILGGWLYLMVAGVAYATRASNRAALAEAAAARAELAALRAQLNPHFLFNTLHTVVQLIPTAPARAAEAAESLAGLLRTTLEQDRDLVPLEEEMVFVDRYLALERIRFGDRLRVRQQIAADAGLVEVPSFAVQTLVENAVRHGAAPNIDPTDIAVIGERVGNTLTVTVTDNGAGTSTPPAESNGTGLRRLRDRLQVLYGPAARLDTTASPNGFRAVLTVPAIDGSDRP